MASYTCIYLHEGFSTSDDFIDLYQWHGVSTIKMMYYIKALHPARYGPC